VHRSDAARLIRLGLENAPAGTRLHAVELREGDALQTLARDLPGQIDLVLLDGAKGLYPAVLTLLEEHLRPRALIIADNADRNQHDAGRARFSRS
jgi:predicted O-methyltransferase YrrM